MSVKKLRSKKGRDQYEINGYVYNKIREKVNPENGEKTISVCCNKSRNFGCRNTNATLIIKDDTIQVKCCSPVENHNHPAPVQDIMARNIKSKIKLKIALDPSKTGHQIYNEVIKEVGSLNENLKEEFNSSKPKYDLIRTIMAREKNKFRPQEPSNGKNFKLGKQWKTVNSENFVLFETNNPDKIIAFATPHFMSILCDETSTKTIYMDGTFDAMPKTFDKLYTIHAFYKKQMFPFVYVLLPNRTEDTYIRMFELIQEAARKLNLCFQPEIVISDFEGAAINAVRRCFPAIMVKGSQFHFSQAVWRKFKQLGLSTFESDEIVKKTKLRSAAIPLCKLEDINEAWRAIVLDSVDENHPAYNDIERFKSYMVETWLDGPNALSWQIWNNYNNFCIRTNNHMEEWHNDLNVACNRKNSNVYDLIGAIKSQHIASNAEMALLDLGGEPQRLSIKYKQINTAIRTATNDYDNGEITLMDFLTSVAFKLPLHA